MNGFVRGFERNGHLVSSREGCLRVRQGLLPLFVAGEAEALPRGRPRHAGGAALLVEDLFVFLHVALVGFTHSVAVRTGISMSESLVRGMRSGGPIGVRAIF